MTSTIGAFTAPAYEFFTIFFPLPHHPFPWLLILHIEFLHFFIWYSLFFSFHTNISYQKTAETLSGVTEKTSSLFGGLGGSLASKLGDLKSSTAFKSFEERVGTAVGSVKVWTLFIFFTQTSCYLLLLFISSRKSLGILVTSSPFNFCLLKFLLPFDSEVLLSLALEYDTSPSVNPFWSIW